MTPRRELLVAMGLCLIGSALVLLALSRPWLSYRISAAPPLPSRQLVLTGARIAPGARVLALVGVAGPAALAATRRWGRVPIGVVLGAAGAGVLAVLSRVLADPAGAVHRSEPGPARSPLVADLGSWPYVALGGGLLLVAAGLLAVVRGRSWTTMSRRYDAPRELTSRGEGSLWDALDRGEDPTQTAPERGG